MTKKIALLRGINVGGKRKILMADLRSMFEDLTFTNIKTYIQSGNVLFTSDKENDHLALSKKIETAINKRFGFAVPVIIRTAIELANSVNENPFYKDSIAIQHLHLSFLSEVPTQQNRQQIEAYHFEPDKFIIKGKDIFIYCESSYHKSKLTNNFFEKKLSVSATTRNWKTVLKLLELSNK